MLATNSVILGTFGGSSVFRVSVGNGSEVAPEEINVTFEDVKVITFLQL
jgi:hypothetical protein